MKRFLLHGLALFVLTNVALADSPGRAGGSPARASVGARRAAQAVRLGREFKLKVGRSVTFEGRDLRLRFVSVADDSRCPIGVNCIWAGNAAVSVEVAAKGGREKKTLTLNTSDREQRPGEGKYGRYTVKLLGLSPQPRDGRKTEPGEYTATLLITLVIVD